MTLISMVTIGLRALKILKKKNVLTTAKIIIMSIKDLLTTLFGPTKFCKTIVVTDDQAYNMSA